MAIGSREGSLPYHACVSVVSPIPPASLNGSAAPIPAWKRLLPNVLTGGRLVLACTFVVVLQRWKTTTVPLSHPDWVLVTAGILFVVAALTDVIDGHLARAWNATSKFGRVMDPFADKVLVLGAFILLAGPDFSSVRTVDPAAPNFHITGVEPWMVVVILARELLVTSLRSMVESGGEPFGASIWGKIKMFVQSAVAPTIIGMVALFDVRPGSQGRTVVLIAAWTAVVVTAVSAIPYVLRAIAAAKASVAREKGEA